MSIEALRTVLPPPATPHATGTPEEWTAIEARIGFTLPTDYKDYIATYGYGRIGGFLVPLNPFFDAGGDFFARADSILATYRQLKADLDPTAIPYPLYPEDEGLFPWAYSFDGDAMFWRREGQPDDWPCVVAALEFNQAVVTYRETMTGLLTDWMAGTLTIPGFPATAPNRDRPFDTFDCEET